MPQRNLEPALRSRMRRCTSPTNTPEPPYRASCRNGILSSEERGTDSLRLWDREPERRKGAGQEPLQLDERVDESLHFRIAVGVAE